MIILLGPVGYAAETVPTGATPVTQSDCTTTPRPTDELRALTLAALPRVTAALQATPISTPAAPDQQEPVMPGEEPADVRTFNAAREVIRQIAACSNAGNLRALVSLYDDEGASVYLAVGYVSFARSTAGRGTTDDAALLDLYLASLQLSVALPAEDRVVAYRVESVTLREDGLVHVVASFARGDEAPSPFSIYLREDTGHYKIVYDVTRISRSQSTPAAATQP